MHVDIVDDGERLETIGDLTQDFVIANHFIEHSQNPIGAIENMLRVLKHGGILYLAVPDKRYTFDIDRPVTTIEHLLQDYEQGPQWSKRQHFEEWSRFIDKIVDRVQPHGRVITRLASRAAGAALTSGRAGRGPSLSMTAVPVVAPVGR